MDGGGPMLDCRDGPIDGAIDGGGMSVLPVMSNEFIIPSSPSMTSAGDVVGTEGYLPDPASLPEFRSTPPFSARGGALEYEPPTAAVGTKEVGGKRPPPEPSSNSVLGIVSDPGLRATSDISCTSDTARGTVPAPGVTSPAPPTALVEGKRNPSAVALYRSDPPITPICLTELFATGIAEIEPLSAKTPDPPIFGFGLGGSGGGGSGGGGSDSFRAAAAFMPLPARPDLPITVDDGRKGSDCRTPAEALAGIAEWVPDLSSSLSKVMPNGISAMLDVGGAVATE